MLAPTKIVTIVAANESLKTELLAFGDALVASNWWKAAGKDYGLSTAAHVRITSTESITANPSTNAMDAFIGRAIAGRAEAADDGNTMYMLYLPAGVVDIDPTQGVNTGCQYHGGYHTLGTSNRVWGFGMRCPLQGTGLTELQSLTIISSHEIIEAATDPDPGRGYTLGFLQSRSDDVWTSTSGETGDMCVSTQITEGLYTYQRVWSNSAAAAGGDPCVPALTTPYYNVSTGQQWYSVAPGATVTIPVTGWSTARMTLDWVIDPQILKTTASGSGFKATMSSATTVTVKGTTYSTINNGRTATLSVVAPNQSGVYAVINVYDLPRTSGGDPYHFYPVGVYTP